MSTPSPSPAGPTFGDPAVVRCERAAAELRAARPVLVDGAGGARVAALALDGSTPATRAALFAAAGGPVALFLTAPRAAVLGLDAPQGALLPVDAGDDALLDRLAWLPDPPAVRTWQAGDATDAAAAALARLALLLPAMLVARLDAAQAGRFAGCAQVAVGDIAHAGHAAGRDYELVTRTRVPLRRYGPAEFAVFRGGVAQRDQVAIVIGQPDLSAPVPVRVHSACLTGDLFGSLKCDCGDQLRNGLATLAELGGGVLLYLDQEGRGTGIAAKMRAYGYQHAGLDTIDADAMLGFGPDERRYGAAAAMLRGLGISRVRLLTNNPAKAERLAAAGIAVTERIPVTGTITAENEGYLRTKAARAGHVLDVDALISSLD